MLRLGSLKRFGFMLTALLVFQLVSASYDSHRELDLASQHLPPHHQDAADGTPHLDSPQHLDHPQHRNHSVAHNDLKGDSKAQQPDGIAQLEQVTPGEHQKPDTVQDCSHCCHCHGSSSLCLPTTNQIARNRTASRWVAAVDAGFAHGYFSTPFRPPIT
ncbi:hypothetical protein [Microbulbifer mangrovi]|uniref:hypothetical protein n=1 Tax=Microbulbifer mangrovi TaxID=927787 RepID=UPI00099072F1|nr:hypothetical protein [Microbulbifer mangrovi]